MTKAAQSDWGFNEIARKFERDLSPAPRTKTDGHRSGLLHSGAARLTLWLGMIALGLIGLVALHISILQKNLEYNGLIQEKNSLTADNARLSSEVSALSSPERIEQIAMGPLGMVPPENLQYVYIGPPGSRQSYADLEGAVPGRLTIP